MKKWILAVTGGILISLVVVMFWYMVNEKSSVQNIWSPTGLKVELMEVPYGIDTEEPAFSWEVNGVADGIYQKKYHIVVSKTMRDMMDEDYLFDTGWCESSENTYVKIENFKGVLLENAVYYWKVQIMDRQSRISKWSDVACFSTGIGNEWASTEGIWNEEQSDYVFFRTEFALPKVDAKLEKALLSVTASSPEETRQYVYNIYLNDEYIGSGPAREKDNTVNYNTFDVTEKLEEKNILGAICYTNKGKAFLCQMTLYYEDGTKKILINSGRDKGEWKVYSGDEAFGKNEAMISTPYYVAHAENINVLYYPDGWLKPGFNADSWKKSAAAYIFSQDSLVPYQTENMQRFYISPVLVEKKGEGHYFVDLGREIVGGIAIDTSSFGIDPKEILLRYGEELDENGNVKYQMLTANVYEERWTIRKGKQSIENIGMKTFRYIDIYGDNISFSAENIKGVEIRQPFPDEKSFFRSSEELLNEIYDLTKYTVKATNQNLYVDSQSRERGAYEGDAWINMMASYTFSDNYTLARVSNEYLYSKRTWPAEYPLVAIMCAWQDYMYTGNIDSLVENYETLKNNIDFFPIDTKCGLVKNNYKEDLFNSPLVDWPETERGGYAYDEAVYNTVVNAVACEAYGTMAQIAEVLNKSGDSSVYMKTSETIKQSMLRYLFNEENGAFSDGLSNSYERIEHYTQHATAYALFAGIYDGKAMREQMVAFLKAQGKIEMSVYGAYFLLTGLYDNDAGEYATQLLLEEDKENLHTWSHMLRENKATITTEAWDAEIKDNMTFSHPWGASPASFIARGIFGIKPIQPGFSEFEIKLQPAGIRFAEIKVPTMKGTIEVYFEHDTENRLINMKAVVPSNTEAVLKCPISETKGLTYTLDGQEAGKETADYLYFVLKAGKHDIRANCGE